MRDARGSFGFTGAFAIRDTVWILVRVRLSTVLQSEVRAPRPLRMQRVRLALEWFLNPDHAPLLIAKSRGWFAEVGIELEIVEPTEHLDALAELESGRLECAITEPIHLVADRAKGGDIVGFARFLHTNGGVMYRRGEVKRPQDMIGKRLQYPGAPGPGGVAIVRSMIERDGGPAEAPLTPVNRGFHHTDALLDDDADLATLVFFNFEVLEARARGLDADFFSLRDWGVPDFCQLVLVSASKWLDDNEDLARRFIAVLQRGIDVIRQDPERAESEYWTASGQDPDDLGRQIYRATTACFTPDFSMSPEYYEQLDAWMRATKQTDREVGPSEAWTNRMVIAAG